MMETNKNQWLTSYAFPVYVLCLLLLSCSSPKKAVQLHADEVRNMVNSSRFTFIAQRVQPLRGSTRNLTSIYDVVVKKDTVECDLPFFGRAYQAPMDPSKGGIQFISSDFSYKVNPKNEKQWEVMISPHDNNDVQQLYFTVFDDGTATLNISNTHRDPISFFGHVEKIKE